MGPFRAGELDACWMGCMMYPIQIQTGDKEDGVGRLYVLDILESKPNATNIS